MDIIKYSSPNHYTGRSGFKPDMIVCHITEGTFDGSVSWLCNPASQASAHFVVGRDGRVAQLVDLQNGSWCNGTSIDPTSKVFYGNSTLQVVKDRKTNANYFTVSIEFEGIYEQTKGKLADAQFNTAVELIKYIKSEVKRIFGVDMQLDRNHIVGHYQVDPITKPNCPGQEFPFDALIKAVNPPPPTPKPVPPPAPAVTPYRVRTAWDDVKSQKGAFNNLDGAIETCKKYPGTNVFDNTGKVMFVNPLPPFPPFRVRLSWVDVKSQKGAFNNLKGAIETCKLYDGYSVYDNTGRVLFTYHK